ncbi:uncharacterized protein [Anoplolepis gracilipes]|uniref:uncharacterized protein n=1 Tax=Anoplolepis gracilipes TaxID=354296 RepID=UPI003B9DC5D6
MSSCICKAQFPTAMQRYQHQQTCEAFQSIRRHKERRLYAQIYRNVHQSQNYDKPFHCPDCELSVNRRPGHFIPVTYNDYPNFREHLQTVHHIDEQDLRMFDCVVTYNIDFKNPKCPWCQRCYSNRTHLRDHLSTIHINSEVFILPTRWHCSCGKNFFTDFTSRTHWDTEHRPIIAPHFCICRAEFSTDMELSQHEQICGAFQRIMRREERKLYTQIYKSVHQSQNYEEPFHCFDCELDSRNDVIYDDYPDFRQHLQTVHYIGEEDLRIFDCFVFYNLPENYPCPCCINFFSSYHYLCRHIAKFHVNPKDFIQPTRFPCECGRNYFTSFSYLEHRKKLHLSHIYISPYMNRDVHGNRRPQQFICNICNIYWESNKFLVQHYNAYHRNDYYRYNHHFKHIYMTAI